MVKGNHVLFLLCIGLCLVTTGVWGQNKADPYEEDNKLHTQWLDQFRTYLESSKYTQLRVATAIHLNQSDDPKAKERGQQLIVDVLDTPFLDAASLWLLASDCRWREEAGWCEPGGVYEMLLQADPENAAVMMMQFSQSSYAGDELLLDTEANLQLLEKVAEAGHFDVYWGRGADKLFEEALEFARLNPLPPTDKLEVPELRYINSPHVYAFFQMVALVTGAPVFAYSNVVNLCRIQARHRYSEGVTACRKLAHTLRINGKSLLTRSIGFAIERTMSQDIDPDHPGVQHWQLRGDLSKLISMCHSSPWQTDYQLLSKKQEPSLMNWAKNLSELGEWEGNKQTAIQEFTASDDNFIMNPIDCDKLNDLDDEEIEILLNGQNPIQAWHTMQKKAVDISVSK